MLFNWLGYSPGLSEILSHSKLIPDVALTLTLTRKRYSEIQTQSQKKIVTQSSSEHEPTAYDSSALNATLPTAIAKFRKSMILMQRT